MITIPAFLTIVAGFFAYRIVSAAFERLGRDDTQRKPGLMVKEGLKAFMAFMTVLFMFELLVFSLMASTEY